MSWQKSSSLSLSRMQSNTLAASKSINYKMIRDKLIQCLIIFYGALWPQILVKSKHNHSCVYKLRVAKFTENCINLNVTVYWI